MTSVSIDFVIAWPIWAGGYPTPAAALRSMSESRPMLVATLEAPLRERFGEAVELDVPPPTLGGYAPIDGLRPAAPAPNSLRLSVTVRRRDGAHLPTPIDGATLTQVVEALRARLEALVRERMPGARQGANLYDVLASREGGATRRVDDAPSPHPPPPAGPPTVPPSLSPTLSPTLPATRSPTLPPTVSRPPVGGVPAPASLAAPAPAPALVDGRRRGRVFVSYARTDAKWLRRLQVHLKPLSTDHGIDLWDDTRITAGSQWRGELDAAMHAADVAVLLVSADFVASDFIRRNELPPLLVAAKQRGVRILPVIVGPSMFDTIPGLEGMQAINDPKDALIRLSKARQEAVLLSVAQEIRRSFSRA